MIKFQWAFKYILTRVTIILCFWFFWKIRTWLSKWEVVLYWQRWETCFPEFKRKKKVVVALEMIKDIQNDIWYDGERIVFKPWRIPHQKNPNLQMPQIWEGLVKIHRIKTYQCLKHSRLRLIHAYEEKSMGPTCLCIHGRVWIQRQHMSRHKDSKDQLVTRNLSFFWGEGEWSSF